MTMIIKLCLIFSELFIPKSVLELNDINFLIQQFMSTKLSSAFLHDWVSCTPNNVHRIILWKKKHFTFHCKLCWSYIAFHTTVKNLSKQTQNKTKYCIYESLNKDTMKEIFVYLTCINQAPVYYEHKKGPKEVLFRQASLYNVNENHPRNIVTKFCSNNFNNFLYIFKCHTNCI